MVDFEMGCRQVPRSDPAPPAAKAASAPTPGQKKDGSDIYVVLGLKNEYSDDEVTMVSIEQLDSSGYVNPVFEVDVACRSWFYPLVNYMSCSL